MLVRNKWNGMMYEVVSVTDKIVTLKRTQDYKAKKEVKGSTFVIDKSEYHFNYSIKE